MSAKMGDFKDDLDVVMSEVRAVLEHWGLGAWKEYLLVRQPEKPESFVVLAHPSDRSDFADKLIALHRKEAE
jgi:hypothetical protein